MNVDQPVMQECPRNAQQWLEHMRNLRNADFILFFEIKDLLPVQKSVRRLFACRRIPICLIC